MADIKAMMAKIQDSLAKFDFNGVKPGRVEAALLRDHRIPEDLAALLSPAARDYLEPMARLARDLTSRFFGRNIVLYTPIYIANYCVNECVYCGYNRKNHIRRAKLTLEEIEAEAEAIAATGLRDILLLTGESKAHSPVDYICQAIGILGKHFTSIGLEVYPMDSSEYEQVRAAGADYISVYQETYDPELYDKVHLSGPKKDYSYRFGANIRALSAGFRGGRPSGLCWVWEISGKMFWPAGSTPGWSRRPFPRRKSVFPCPGCGPIPIRKK